MSWAVVRNAHAWSGAGYVAGSLVALASRKPRNELTIKKVVTFGDKGRLRI
jgi:hypothetical protein